MPTYLNSLRHCIIDVSFSTASSTSYLFQDEDRKGEEQLWYIMRAHSHSHSSTHHPSLLSFALLLRTDGTVDYDNMGVGGDGGVQTWFCTYVRSRRNHWHVALDGAPYSQASILVSTSARAYDKKHTERLN